MIEIRAEEKVSFYTHFSGVLMAVVGIILLLITSEKVNQMVISLIYGISVIILFSSSSLYHAFKKKEDEISIWRKLDHFAIFIMIAGTYTPVCYVYLTGYWKWSIIIVQWSLVLGGFFFKFFYLKAPRYLYTVIYLLMGWSGIIPIKQFINHMSIDSLLYLLLGGVAFSIGAVFYMLKKPRGRYFGFHEIFHLFILVGAFLHFLLVYNAIHVI
ncbi:MAG: PAQR family membrane homeostasis protein TrhA [Halanaerobiales bacterium]